MIELFDVFHRTVRYRTEAAITVIVDAFVTHHSWSPVADGVEVVVLATTTMKEINQ